MFPPNLDLNESYQDDENCRLINEEPKPSWYRTPCGWFDEDAYNRDLLLYIAYLARKLK